MAMSQNAVRGEYERAEASARENLLSFFLAHERERDVVAATQKVDGLWREWTWGELLDRAARLSEALVASGIAPGDRVCIYSDSRLEWVLADLAIVGAGGITVPIYGSNTPEEVAYIVENSQAKMLFVDHDRGAGGAEGRWKRLAQIAERTRGIQRFVGFELESKSDERLVSLTEFEEEGAEILRQHPARRNALQERANAIGKDELCCILYTSGTTGDPKGVMLTHENWAAQVRAVADVELLLPTDVVMLFLPLAHAFARVVEVAWIGLGFKLAFAESADKVVENMAEVGATVLPAVPRVFEKAYAKVLADGTALPGLQGRLFRWAIGEFERRADALEEGGKASAVMARARWALARALVFGKLRERLSERFGGRMRLFISGGAPLAAKFCIFFNECGLKLVEGYGLTETCAPTHANRNGDIKPGTVGRPLLGIEARIASDGELLVRGPQIMVGYYNQPEETAAVLDAEGWFHTGDIGTLDAEGRLTITDRKKDLIKTSAGKYVAPQQLENALKQEPLIGHVAIVGDKRRFIAALVTISEEVAKRWASAVKLPASDYTSLVMRPELRERIQTAIDAVNQRLPRHAAIRRFAILEQEWSQLTGELTPKLSVRRKIVEAKFKRIVDSLYGQAEQGGRP